MPLSGHTPSSSCCRFCHPRVQAINPNITNPLWCLLATQSRVIVFQVIVDAVQFNSCVIAQPPGFSSLSNPPRHSATVIVRIVLNVLSKSVPKFSLSSNFHLLIVTMGAVVSYLEQRQTTPAQSSTLTETTDISEPSCPSASSPNNPGARPSHISFPSFGTLALSPSSSPSQRENPFERPLLSPTLTFYTAPSTPLTSPQADDPPPDPNGSSSPPEVVLHVPPPPAPPSEAPVINRLEEKDTSPTHDDAFPNVEQVHVDTFSDDEGLSSLEKIYLFSRSQATFHRWVLMESHLLSLITRLIGNRVFITHSLSTFMDDITPSEAVEYVLPLLSGLAMDPGMNSGFETLSCQSYQT